MWILYYIVKRQWLIYLMIVSIIILSYWPIFEDGGETGEEIFDGWGHLGHSDHVDNALQGPQDTAQYLRVLLSQVLVQHHSQVTHQSLL